MNYNNCFLYHMCIVLSSMMILGQSASAFSLPSFKNYTLPLPSFLSSKQEEETIQKEYPMQENGIVTIKNNIGNICIKTEWNQNKVFVTATKKASSKELLQNIEISERTTPHVIVLETQHKDAAKGRIDYTLIVPHKTTLNLATNQGNITVQEANGRLTATSEKGNIEINNSSEIVIATTSTGSIAINCAQGKVQASAQKGDITITDAVNSVFAKTEHGRINMKSKQVPSLSKIKLATSSGPIEIQLPAQVNANLKANTQRGTIVSQLPITLKPYTTTLDAHAWRQFKEQVNGTFGTGNAQIILHTKRGHIKILDTKTA